MRYTIFLFFFFGAILNSCTKDKLPVIDPINEPACDPEINYDNTMQTIINNSCAIPNCHVSGGDGPGRFNSYQGILGRLDNGQVENEVVIRRSMPLSPGELTEEEFDLFRCWLEAGYPEN